VGGGARGGGGHGRSGAGGDGHGPGALRQRNGGGEARPRDPRARQRARHHIRLARRQAIVPARPMAMAQTPSTPSCRRRRQAKDGGAATASRGRVG
jgi:hypothetical protein